MEINIREYVPLDENNVYKINKKTLEINFKSLYNIFHRNHPDLFLVAENPKNYEIVGFILVTLTKKFENKDSGLIYAIAIHPNYQGKGIGKQLIKKMRENLLKRNVHTLYLHVKESNKKAINFYKNLGFKKLNHIKRFYSWGEGAFRMKLELDNVNIYDNNDSIEN
ncbi:MAG: GNAT family N-acetyltransferase [Candidatus Helarchaeota archaeon]